MSRADLARMDWDDYRVFVAIARTGSCRAASRDLNMTAPAVTRRLASLEAKLGQRLVKRVTHGVELTSDGKRVFAYAEAADMALTRIHTHAHDAPDRIEGECRLAMTDGMAIYWLPRFLPVFAQRYPDVVLYSHVATERTMSKAPSHDIQIQYTDTPDENLVAVRVATVHSMLFASAEYLAEHGTPRTMEDLKDHRIVDFTLNGSDKGTLGSWRGLADRTCVITNSMGSMCELVRFGQGIGMLPSYAGVVHANLLPVLPEIRFPTQVYLCYEREAAKRPAVRTMLSFLKDVVFDARRLPWFADDFVAPDPRWANLLNDVLDGPHERRKLPYVIAGARA